MTDLTPRESDVLRQLCLGRTNSEVSAQLGISARTVEVHRLRLMEKLEAKSAVELGVIAQLRGML